MWILARYILKEHLAPFLFSFLIVTFVLLLDFIPRVMEMIIGKDLSVWIVLKLLVLNLAWMLALSVPMSALVSTLMAFGRLTSDKEILAIKAGGINITITMIPVFIVAAIVGASLIWFNNNVLPDANHKASTLRGDIRRMKPTLRLQSGVFIDYIPGYIILVNKVDHENSTLQGVVIYDQKNPRRIRTITAAGGKIEFSARGEYITFTLEDGQVHEQSLIDETDYRISTFKTQVFTIDNLGTHLEESERSYRSDREMSTTQMMAKTTVWKKQINDYNHLTSLDADSILRLVLSPPADPLRIRARSESEQKQVIAGRAYHEFSDIARMLKTRQGQIQGNRKLISKYSVEIQKKFSLPAACLAFVLIGAPLGVIGRRGGMALSVGISIGMFTLYWAFLIGGEQLADRLIIPAWVAMWAANILLSLLGLWLIYWVKNERVLPLIIKRLFWRSHGQ